MTERSSLVLLYALRFWVKTERLTAEQAVNAQAAQDEIMSELKRLEPGERSYRESWEMLGDFGPGGGGDKTWRLN